MDSDRELLIGNPTDTQNEAINRNYDSVVCFDKLFVLHMLMLLVLF